MFIKNSCIVVIALLTGFCRLQAGQSPTFYRAQEFYTDNRLDSAEVMFAEAAIENGSDPITLSWYAECLRRNSKTDIALKIAFRALQFDSCNSMACGTIADVMSPQFREHSLANRDSSLAYNLRGVKCDSTNGNIWCSIWSHAVSEDNENLAKQAIQRLYQCNFLTPAVLEQNRFYLESLPKDAILLTNGDFDTYPGLALQLVKGLRPDVAIVNTSMLNLPAYGKFVSRTNSIPDAFPNGGWSMIEYRWDDTLLVTIAQQVIAKWTEMAATGQLKRPLAACITTAASSLPSGFYDKCSWKGPYFLWDKSAQAETDDALAARKSIENVDFVLTCGRTAAKQDYSAIHIYASKNRIMGQNLLQVVKRIFDVEVETGECSEAAHDLSRLEKAISETDSRSAWSDVLSDMQSRLEAKCPK